MCTGCVKSSITVLPDKSSDLSDKAGAYIVSTKRRIVNSKVLNGSYVLPKGTYVYVFFEDLISWIKDSISGIMFVDTDKEAEFCKEYKVGRSKYA